MHSGPDPTAEDRPDHLQLRLRIGSGALCAGMSFGKQTGACPGLQSCLGLVFVDLCRVSVVNALQWTHRDVCCSLCTDAVYRRSRMLW